MNIEVSAWLADLLVLSGLIFMTAAVYGMIWLPDVYTRLHTAGKGVVLAIIPLLFSLFASGDAAITVRVLLIAALLLITTPVSAHAIALAAYKQREAMQTPDTLDESERLQT